MTTSSGRPRLVRGLSLCSVACAFALAAACSGADDAPNKGVNGGSGGAQGGNGGSANGANGGSAGSGAGGSGGFIDAGGSDALDPDAACGAVKERAQAFPLNLYIMLDKSNSMAGYKWDAVKDGITAFVNDSNSAGLNVALNFFPRSGPASCDQTLFKAPNVPFGELPGNAQSLIDALNAESPNGLGTTTYPALGGAILKGIENGQNDSTKKNAVLLVTDGNPQWPTQPPPMCGSDNPESTQDIAGLAAAGYGFSPSVTTFVVGLDGVQTSFANSVAAAGGSGQAILISSTNAAQEFKDALKKVRGQALPCEYTLPTDVEQGKIAYDRVNVVFTPGGGSQQTLLQTDDCNAGGGWYYDDPAMPTQILLCPTACEQVKADFDAALDILLGCKTERVK